VKAVVGAVAVVAVVVDDALINALVAVLAAPTALGTLVVADVDRAASPHPAPLPAPNASGSDVADDAATRPNESMGVGAIDVDVDVVALVPIDGDALTLVPNASVGVDVMPPLAPARDGVDTLLVVVPNASVGVDAPNLSDVGGTAMRVVDDVYLVVIARTSIHHCTQSPSTV
jgi:hypothetical protein